MASFVAGECRYVLHRHLGLDPPSHSFILFTDPGIFITSQVLGMGPGDPRLTPPTSLPSFLPSLIPPQVLGMYPGDPGEPGSDCAGVIMAVGGAGEKLHGHPPPSDAAAGGNGDLVVGDRVFGLAHGCLGTLVSGPGCMMAKMPPGMTMQVRAPMLSRRPSLVE